MIGALLAATALAASHATAPSAKVEDPTVLESEIVVAVSVAKAWGAFANDAGLRTWMAPLAEMDLRVGGKIRTSYNAQAKLGDESTIEHTILCYDPEHVFSFRTTKAPKGFPYPKALAKTWCIVYFEPVSAGKTRLRLRMLGYDDTEESKAMRKFFATGNAYTFEQLKKALERKG